MKKIISFLIGFILFHGIFSYAQNPNVVSYWEPPEPNPGESVTIYYNDINGTLPDNSTKTIKLHWGINASQSGGWKQPPQELWPAGSVPWSDNTAIQTPMFRNAQHWWQITIPTSNTVKSIHWVFTDGNNWDNNNSADWNLYLKFAPGSAQHIAGLITDKAGTAMPNVQVKIFALFSQAVSGIDTTDLEGRYEISFVTSVKEIVSALPEGFMLYQNYPNPFEARTNIRYDLPEPAEVKIQIYNVLGQVVTELENGRMEQGCHYCFWNGSDNKGLRVANGIYFGVLTAGDYRKAIKMLVLPDTYTSQWTVSPDFPVLSHLAKINLESYRIELKSVVIPKTISDFSKLVAIYRDTTLDFTVNSAPVPQKFMPDSVIVRQDSGWTLNLRELVYSDDEPLFMATNPAVEVNGGIARVYYRPKLNFLLNGFEKTADVDFSTLSHFDPVGSGMKAEFTAEQSRSGHGALKLVMKFKQAEYWGQFYHRFKTPQNWEAYNRLSLWLKDCKFPSGFRIIIDEADGDRWQLNDYRSYSGGWNLASFSFSDLFPGPKGDGVQNFNDVVGYALEFVNHNVQATEYIVYVDDFYLDADQGFAAEILVRDKLDTTLRRSMGQTYFDFAPFSVTLSGQIVDAMTKSGIANAKIIVGEKSTNTDLFGHFNFPNLLSGNTNCSIIDDTSGVGIYHNRMLSISLSADTSLTLELVPIGQTGSPDCSTLLEMLKQKSHNNGYHEDTILERWPTLPIPVFIAEHAWSHFGVEMNFKAIVQNTMNAFEEDVNACLPTGRKLQLFKFVDSEIGANGYGIDVGFPETTALTWIGFNEWDRSLNSSPLYSKLNVRFYSPADSLGNVHVDDLKREIRNALYTLLIDCDGDAKNFWGRHVQFFRTQSHDAMNEDLVDELTEDHDKLIALAYSLNEPLPDLASFENEKNRAPIAIASEDDTVYTNTIIALDASKSFDPDGDVLTYSWTQIGGPTVNIVNSNLALAQVSLPRFNNYTFKITVADSKGAQASDLVQIYAVSNAPDPEPIITQDSLIVATYYITLWGRKYDWPPNINCGKRSVDFTLGFPFYHNLLGNYDTVDPKVADWHIKMALENGINTFIIMASDITEKGLFKAKHFDKIKILPFLNTEPWWGPNLGGPPSQPLEEYLEQVIAYFSQKYFVLPNCIKIAGKPAFLIYHLGIYRSSYGQENLEWLVQKIRKEGMKYGLDFFLIGDIMGPLNHNVSDDLLMINLFDGISSYAMWEAGTGWKFKNNTLYLEVPYESNVQGYLNEASYYSNLCVQLGKSFIPPATLGADLRNTFSIGYDTGYIYHKNPNSEKFGQLLTGLKPHIDATANMIIIYAWNEFHESTVLEPTEEMGYQYLEQVRNVFGIQPAGGWPINIIP